MKILFLIILCLGSLKAFANTSFWVGAGTITHNFLSAQNVDNGSKKLIEIAPTFFIGTSMPFIFSGIYFTPAVGFSKYFTDDNSTKEEYIIQYHFSHLLFPSFELAYGFSNYITNISGDGSSVVLNNGLSTAVFYAPSATQTSYTASLDLAGEYTINNNWRTKIQFSLLRFLSSTKRRVSNLITLNYFF
jgi:hypothetical protein